MNEIRELTVVEKIDKAKSLHKQASDLGIIYFTGIDSSSSIDDVISTLEAVIGSIIEINSQIDFKAISKRIDENVEKYKS